jgi:hypothetical protein
MASAMPSTSSIATDTTMMITVTKNACHQVPLDSTVP